MVDAASATSTVIEIRASDSIGLLYRITATLFALDLDVVAARVSTGTHEVVDAFYVRDRTTGGKITAPMRESFSMFSKWISFKGVSRTNSTSLRRSFRITSAAR